MWNLPVEVTPIDPKQLKQWMELAQSFQGQDFWKGVFNEDNGKQMIQDFQQENTRANQVQPQTHSHQDLHAHPAADFPKYELSKSKDYLYVVVELPGIQKGDVELAFAGEQILVKGNAKPIKPEMTVIQSERYVGEFERIITLPEPVNESDIQAEFKNGLLEVKMGRFRRNHKPIQIK
ncbi:Hsp20/alpha crystallin family protein [Halobacillus salinarum]|uniref:Hsp20/alpha crystallin family protein n=1 Tax=Halobacillus salinarum TaxID=2932257 RepID=A0ABY4EHZ1_9BACI|nr:Hsp20/alpha crystallin family protein [Halobacillus salinarum]UOQ44040.1 Hsp20/alpha crystallin family protein [Halobacillus salinarum]